MISITLLFKVLVAVTTKEDLLSCCSMFLSLVIDKTCLVFSCKSATRLSTAGRSDRILASPHFFPSSYLFSSFSIFSASSFNSVTTASTMDLHSARCWAMCIYSLLSLHFFKSLITTSTHLSFWPPTECLPPSNLQTSSYLEIQ